MRENGVISTQQTKGDTNMIKHITGLILFSFIVGFSVFVSAVTDTSVPVTLSDDYRLTKKKKKKRKHKRRHCDYRQRNVHEVTLEKAVFNESTGMFSTGILSERHRMGGDVDLHFYANDRFGPRFLKTERFISTGYDDGYAKEMRWLKELDQDQDVFVMAVYASGWTDTTIPPEFDPSKALPVEMVY